MICDPASDSVLEQGVHGETGAVTFERFKMRGNWDTAEPLVHAPNQQLQQQTIVEEQRHPLHSPTTPGWGITDRIVKEEPVEDKNNDSGVSPDHYTSNSASPRSRRSSSTANCSLSPGSATSQDSNNMQCATFDYSPQRVYKTCSSPLGFVRHPAMDDNQQDQAMDIVSSTMKQTNEDTEIGQDTLQCPICSFATLNRLKFTEHLTTHCTTKCDTPDFMKAVISQITNANSMQEENNRASPTQGERSEHESEEADEPGLRVPRVNSQGKVKTFRCKQCNFVAITKLEFWEHSRGHIKAEKLLTCPKCPFVTEYKHHLEYHLRNHFGSKPFKCDKCSYSCVNKSMLNSHLKSHSNVYQYRCANCSYATKYCHSLKLHLRKYGHQPAMVLNADGSPNPLPIIDVYGTRRGPKQKPMKSQDDTLPPTNNNIQTNINNQLVVPPQISPVSHHLPVTPVNSISPMNGINPMTAIATINGVTSVTPVTTINGVTQSQTAVLAFPYNQIFAGFPIAHRFPLTEDTEKQMKTTVDYSKPMETERVSSEFPQDLAIRCFGMNGVSQISNGITQLPNGVTQTPNQLSNGVSQAQNGIPSSPKMTGSVTTFESTEVKAAAPLDLSKPDTPSSQQQRIVTNSPRASGTSRRKGRAVKLERRVIENDTDEEHPQEETEESFEPPAASSPGSKELKESTEKNFGGVGMSNEFTCQYCEIAFGNVVMYTVHMGYHGYNDPYTCNMCGHQSTDKVSFFLHIARSKHS